MFKTYEITLAENKLIAKLGKTVLECTLKDETGATYEKVVLWPEDWTLANYHPGSKITGQYVEKVNGNFVNKTLKPERTNTLNRGSGIKAAQERKEVMIEKAQERKNSSIAYFNAVNSAIALVSNDKSFHDYGTEGWESIIEGKISRWRDWFLSEWQKYDAQDETNKKVPF